MAPPDGALQGGSSAFLLPCAGAVCVQADTPCPLPHFAAIERRQPKPSAARRQHGVRALARPALDRAVAEGRSEVAGRAVVLDAEHRPLVGLVRILVHVRHPAYRLVLKADAPFPSGTREDTKAPFSA